MTTKLTKEQQDWVCYQIGEWYLDWKGKIVPGGGEHKLGVAKEQLKIRLCEKPIDFGNVLAALLENLGTGDIAEPSHDPDNHVCDASRCFSDAASKWPPYVPLSFSDVEAVNAQREQPKPPPLRMLPDGTVKPIYQRSIDNCNRLDGIIRGLFSRPELQGSKYLAESMQELVAEIKAEIE